MSLHPILPHLAVLLHAVRRFLITDENQTFLWRRLRLLLLILPLETHLASLTSILGPLPGPGNLHEGHPSDLPAFDHRLWDDVSLRVVLEVKRFEVGANNDQIVEIVHVDDLGYSSYKTKRAYFGLYPWSL